MAKNVIIAMLPSGDTKLFSSRYEARQKLHLGCVTVDAMIDYGTLYQPVGIRGQFALAGLRMKEVTVGVGGKVQCLSCRHILPFEAVEGVRYVCCLYGKRITEEPPQCKGYKKGEERRHI